MNCAFEEIFGLLLAIFHSMIAIFRSAAGILYFGQWFILYTIRRACQHLAAAVFFLANICTYNLKDIISLYLAFLLLPSPAPLALGAAVAIVYIDLESKKLVQL